jgi:hypothetical protein
MPAVGPEEMALELHGRCPTLPRQAVVELLSGPQEKKDDGIDLHIVCASQYGTDYRM